MKKEQKHKVTESTVVSIIIFMNELNRQEARVVNADIYQMILLVDDTH